MYDPVRRQPPALQPGCKNFPLYLPPETDIVSPPFRTDGLDKKERYSEKSMTAGKFFVPLLR